MYYFENRVLIGLMETFITKAQRNTPIPSTRILLHMFHQIGVEAFSLHGLLDQYGDTQSFGREE
jgi:hypothetical protein